MAKGEVGCAENLGIAVLCASVTADSRIEALGNRILCWNQCHLCCLCLCLLVGVLSLTLGCFYLP